MAYEEFGEHAAEIRRVAEERAAWDPLDHGPAGELLHWYMNDADQIVPPGGKTTAEDVLRAHDRSMGYFAETTPEERNADFGERLDAIRAYNDQMTLKDESEQGIQPEV